MTHQELAYAAVTNALIDTATQEATIAGLVGMVTAHGARRHSMTVIEMQVIDMLHSESWERLPAPVKQAIGAWQASLVSTDGNPLVVL